MIKVLGLALYGPLAASTRYRLMQYTPGFASVGIDLQVSSLLGDDYLRSKFNGGMPPITTMLEAGLTRLSVLSRKTKYDLAILYCELFPLMPGWLERWLMRVPYVYDFDDAFYLRYRKGRLRFLRPFLGNKVDTVIEGAAAVTAGNQVLGQYARKLNPNIYQLPTVVDTERYRPMPVARSDKFTVGWIGSPSTASYLAELVLPLSTIGREGPVRLVVIGGKAPYIPHVEVAEIAWREATEVELINSFDVGVMPLLDDDWARGKCAFKLVQYMACSVPVIASPVGANVDVVEKECGILAATPDEWVVALRKMRDSPRERADMGVASRSRVVQEYSLQKNLPRLAEVIHSVVRRN